MAITLQFKIFVISIIFHSLLSFCVCLIIISSVIYILSVTISYQIINQSNNSAFNFNQSHRIKANYNGKDLAINLIKNSIK